MHIHTRKSASLLDAPAGMFGAVRHHMRTISKKQLAVVIGGCHKQAAPQQPPPQQAPASPSVQVEVSTGGSVTSGLTDMGGMGSMGGGGGGGGAQVTQG
jgi:hypothetical protein